MIVDIDHFERLADCVYKEEHYSVRDNGAVFRHSRNNKPLRKHDNLWTFGNPNNCGYLLIGSEVVHRIVGYAFLGEPPTEKHIIDHIDTNRQNNRPENLRWVTKLDNILNNPITVKKIKFSCGSIEAFLKDPSILKDFEAADKNFNWMRTVTPEEAQASWKRLSSWAKKEINRHSHTGKSIDEWLFQDIQNDDPRQEASELVISYTPKAVQKNWKRLCEFPHCPQENSDNPIKDYSGKLKAGQVFSQNEYFHSIITDFAISKDENILWVLCKNSKEEATKPWYLAQVTYENHLFVHANLGSFFKKEGADKYFTIAQGFEWTGGEVYDDLT